MNERNSNYWLSRVHTLLKAKVLTLGGLDLNTLQFSAYIPFKTFGCQRLFLDSFQFRSSLLPKAVAFRRQIEVFLHAWEKSSGTHGNVQLEGGVED